MLHSEIVGKDTIDIVFEETSSVLIVIFVDGIDELTAFSYVSFFKLGDLVPS